MTGVRTKSIGTVPAYVKGWRLWPACIQIRVWRSVFQLDFTSRHVMTEIIVNNLAVYNAFSGRQPTTRRSKTANIKNIILLCSTSPKCHCAAKKLSSFVIFAELLPLRNVEWLSCLILKTHDRIFIHLDKTTDCDGRTDRQTDRISLAITANSEHCGGAVK